MLVNRIEKNTTKTLGYTIGYTMVYHIWGYTMVYHDILGIPYDTAMMKQIYPANDSLGSTAHFVYCGYETNLSGR